MKVLVAEDSATVRTWLTSELRRWGFAPVLASNGAEAWELLMQDDAPRLALLDWEMPFVNGTTLCKRLRTREEAGEPYTYVVLLTGRGQEALVEGMEAGADDYVIKPFGPDELRARLRAGRRVVELQNKLYRIQEEYRAQSRTDPLTGCLNRRAVMERFTAEAAAARRERSQLAVAVLDLDHFKQVNDLHGHSAGDAVLCELVRRLRTGLRASDTFGRVGGEEFLVLWPDSGERSGAAAERLRALVADTPFMVGPAELEVTASIGVTTTRGDEPLERVIARADEALYVAKAGGRNRIQGGAAPGALALVAG